MKKQFRYDAMPLSSRFEAAQQEYVTPETAYQHMTGSRLGAEEHEAVNQYVTPAAAQRAFLGKTSGSEADAARARMLNRMGIRGGESSSAEEARERMIQRSEKRGSFDP